MAPEEVVRWYNEWKSRFPIEISSLIIIQGTRLTALEVLIWLISTLCISEQFKRALIAMKHAQQGVHLTKEMQPPLPSPEPVPGMYNPAPPRTQPPSSHMSFKVRNFLSLSLDNSTLIWFETVGFPGSGGIKGT